jgi:hypothetical protein
MTGYLFKVRVLHSSANLGFLPRPELGQNGEKAELT